jgi:hypothetical protein
MIEIAGANKRRMSDNSQFINPIGIYGNDSLSWVRDMKVPRVAALFFWLRYPCVYITLGQEAQYMPQSLTELEARRAELVKQFARLGDLRSGSISDTSGRCGKSNCHCHQPGQPVHGPNPRLTYKVQGKTVTESLPSTAAQKKAEREIAEFRRFEQLIRDFIAVNALICHARSAVEQPLSKEKKRQRRPAKRPPSS